MYLDTLLRNSAKSHQTTGIMTVNHLDYCLFISVECFFKWQLYWNSCTKHTLTQNPWKNNFPFETWFGVTWWIIWVQKQAALKEIKMCVAGGKRGILDGGCAWNNYAPGCLLICGWELPGTTKLPQEASIIIRTESDSFPYVIIFASLQQSSVILSNSIFPANCVQI